VERRRRRLGEAGARSRQRRRAGQLLIRRSQVLPRGVPLAEAGQPRAGEGRPAADGFLDTLSALATDGGSLGARTGNGAWVVRRAELRGTRRGGSSGRPD
jgi:hypothetical protein